VLALVLVSTTPALADISVSVSGTEFVVHEDGRQLRPEEVVGLELRLSDEAGTMADFRIEGTTLDPNDPEIRLYDVSLKIAGEWQHFCRPGPDGLAMAFPLAGKWTPTGRHDDHAGFVLTCTAGAIGKCVRFGYKPWKTTPSGVSLWPYHEACTRMVRADYCGDGRSWTKDGTPIDLYDRLSIQTEDKNDGLEFEAAWSPDGAHCVSHTRIPALITTEQLERTCRRHVVIEKCSPRVMQDDSGILLLNNSH
jgi:hypothetical protein